MRLLAHTVLTICLTVMNGCASEWGRTAESADSQNVGQDGGSVLLKREPNMVEIERLAITKTTVTLYYRVTNIFPHDIWVCEDVNGKGRSSTHIPVETRILHDTLRIRLRHGNLESNLIHIGNIWARYRRVSPGEGRTCTVTVPLPARNRSPVFYAENLHAPKKPVIIGRILFELGYLKEDLPTLLSQSKERGWYSKDPDDSPDRTHSPYGSGDPNVAYVHYYWKGTRLLEQSARLTVTNVNLPALVATDMKWMAPEYREEWEEWGEKSRKKSE